MYCGRITDGTEATYSRKNPQSAAAILRAYYFDVFVDISAVVAVGPPSSLSCSRLVETTRPEYRPDVTAATKPLAVYVAVNTQTTE